MKLLTNKKQTRIMALIREAQKGALEHDFFKVTDCLAEIAGEVLTFGQLFALKDAILVTLEGKEKNMGLYVKRLIPDEAKVNPETGMKPDDRLMLILLPDGDIEIWTGRRNGYAIPIPNVRIRCRPYNPGDDLKQSLMEEYEALREMERKVGI